MSQPREAGRSVTRTPRQCLPGDRNLFSLTVRAICRFINARLLLTALEPMDERETEVKGKMNCFWTSAASCKIGFRKDGPLGKKRLDDEVYSELREHARERVPDRNGPLHHVGGRKVGQELDLVQLCHETPLASVQRTVQDGVTCCLLGLAPFWWSTSCSSPLKRGPTTCLLSQRLEWEETPERKQRVRVGGVLWPAAHLPSQEES